MLSCSSLEEFLGCFVYLSLREVILQEIKNLHEFNTSQLNQIEHGSPVRFISFQIKYPGRLNFSGFSNFVPENLFSGVIR